MSFLRVFLKTFGFLSAILIFVILLNILFYLSNNFEKNQFSIIKGQEKSNNAIASIHLNGPIFNNTNNFLGSGFYDYINPLEVRNYLNQLKKLKIKVLVVNIDSPGGTVSASSELENIFNDFKKANDVKLYFHTKELLASGGYWVATSADKIFASYGSIIGSIGVSGPSWYYYNTPISLSSGILGQSIETKNGIEVFNQNSGQSKDLFNPYRKPEYKEIEHLQNIVDDIYEDFATKVSKSRKIDLSIVKNNIGAMIYNSNQAKDNFLINDILDYEQLIEFIIKENNFENYKIYENKNNSNLINTLVSNFRNNNNVNYYNKFCKKLMSSVHVVIPLFFKQC